MGKLPRTPLIIQSPQIGSHHAFQRFNFQFVSFKADEGIRKSSFSCHSVILSQLSPIQRIALITTGFFLYCFVLSYIFDNLPVMLNYLRSLSSTLSSFRSMESAWSLSLTMTLA